MNIDALAGMIFVLLIIAMSGGLIVFLPISLRLGRLLEKKLDQRGPDEVAAGEVRELRAAVRAMQAELERLSERQESTESLLAERQPLLIEAERES